MSVPVEINSIIRRLNSTSIKFIQPLYEAIANSLEANATKIEVELFHDEAMNDTVPQKLIGFRIIDNGEGFTEKNRKAFCEFWTPNKLDMGCKGSGRFLWLTVYDHISVYSEVATENVVVDFDFNKKFDTKNIKPQQKKVTENKTILSFGDVTKRFYDSNKNIDTRAIANIDKICESVKEYLLIKLFLLKNRGISFNIVFKMDDKERKILNADIPNLKREDFKLETTIGFINYQYSFTLYYHFFSDGRGWKKGFYCANDRAAQKMDEKDLGFSGELPNRDSFTILLCSEYFNDKDDDSRTELNALKDNKERSDAVPFLFADIRPVMQQKMKEIIKNTYPEIEILNKKAINEAVDEAPYLAGIIYEDEEIVKTKDSLLKKAKSIFTDRKEKVQKKFLKIIKETNIDKKEFISAVNDISDIAAAELGEYVLYRDCLITALAQAIQDKSTKEAVVHNLIMKKRTSSEETDEDKHLLSNLWLLDDKYMTYSYAASDSTVKKIVDDILEKDAKYKQKNKPDLSIFFNRQNGYKDLIMIELKGPNADGDEKNKAITEIVNNLEIVSKNIPDINSIWSYIITTIDADFARTLKNQDYTELFCNDSEARIFFRYYKALNANVYALDLKAIVSDAKARNQTFLSILKKKSN